METLRQWRERKAEEAWLEKSKELAKNDPPFCPVCGSPEVNPDTGLLNVRGYKVDLGDGNGWWSECLRCLVWFNEDKSKREASDRKTDFDNGIGDLAYMRLGKLTG
jgi:hypothetical protein